MKRKLVGFDIETFFIVNQVAPQPVCVSLYVDGKRELHKAREGAARLKQLLTDERVDLVAHNANFDLISLSVFDLQLFKMFFDAMKQGRVYCSKLAEILLNTADPACEGHARVNVFIDRGEEYATGRWLPVSSNALVGCAYKYLGVDLSGDKDSDLRLSYGELVDVPLDQWSHAARDYAEGDAQYTHDVLIAQYERGAQLAERIGVNPLDDLARQTCAEYVLQLSSTVLGVQVDVDRIDAAVEGLMNAHDEGIETAVLYGLYKPTKNERGYSTVNSQVQTLLQRAVDIVGVDHPTTSAGKLTTNKTAMSTLYDAIDYALSYKRNLDHKAPLSPLDIAELAGIQAAFKSREASETAWKAKRTFLDALRGAVLNPDQRLRYKYNGLMETGRTSSSSPNLQNIPRTGAARSCIQPRAGHIFIIADYSNAELRTLAQAHLNEGRASRLATEYRRDPHFDPHLFMAVRIIGGGMTYDEGLAVLGDKAHPQYAALKEKRQLSKIANFGYAGGLGAEQFIDYAKGYGTRMTVDEATVLRDQWLETWNEMNDYFEQRGTMLREAEEADVLERVEALHNGRARRSKPVNDRDWSCVYHFRSSNRVRYLRKFTIACNTPFQGIASDGAKDALIDVFGECFFDRTSPLFKCKPVLFVHDEIVLEVPFDGSAQAHRNASNAAFRLRDLMVDGMQRHTPDVPAVAEPCLSYEWTKDAESDVLDGGLLSIYASKE